MANHRSISSPLDAQRLGIGIIFRNWICFHTSA
jgi:hypothetical protein